MAHAQNGSVGNSPRISSLESRDQLAWKKVSYTTLISLLVGVPGVVQYISGLPWWVYPVTFLLCLLPTFGAFMIIFNRICVGELGTKCNVMSKYVKFNDPSLEKSYSNRKIPIYVLYESYADGKLDFKMEPLQALEHRNEFTTYELGYYHLKFFLCNFVPELLSHSRTQDCEQVRDHYDRGNDFYEAFLGPMMIYTSGIVYNEDESLEDAQRNKLSAVCEKVQLKKGDKHLDIGCGWGTLVNYAAENYGSYSTGVTLAKNQVEWGNRVAQLKGVENRVNFLCLDYRDIPRTKYNKITCLEMAEHVGIRNFQSFLWQVREMLEDNGVFFLQIAGLRRAWQWEDFIWGLFMAKYIFPGADASCPLGWFITHLEQAGFEVQGTEKIGIHYSYTINRWYENWMRPEAQEAMVKKYGRIARIWNIFLSWSTIIARQGNSTCTQIVCHKNLNGYDRTRFYQKKRN
ncbi:predicted protein [Nematostella vectensis]|uniref:sphingolipid C(9)-methyltransferase n=1 Tax=Nematostella vectensis TaxID=45351 RepID=A7SB91_NEMVE|nr:predicted protein [Nematostella vectensis]|eukprot:XP_001631109.1 predicted protein [Nematostella vectensis]